MKLRSVLFNAGNRQGVLGSLLGVLFSALLVSSCESIYDDQGDCPRGALLRFVYEYHMERGANAFPQNVDCITVYVFDQSGGYVTQFSETSEILQNEDYRMLLPLPAGSYRLVAYGGVACEESRFEVTPRWGSPEAAGLTLGDMRITLPRDPDSVSRKQLHDMEKRTGGLFYGVTEVTLREDDYQEKTVYMMKNTNNIQVILQETDSPYTADYREYDFKIIDDNFVLNSTENDAIEIATEDYRPYYEPYAFENRTMGYVEYVDRNGALLEEIQERPVQVACAEFSTSRLLLRHLPTARLVITNHETGEPVVDLPLIKYLIGIRGFGDSWIKDDQEFLDRQSRWSLMFFLQSGRWLSMRISVNWWTVRFNNASLGR